MRNFLSVAAIAAALVACTTASATPAHSWNLSRSMMNGFTSNPFGEGQVWTAMYDAVGETLNPAKYQPMPNFVSNYDGRPNDAWTFPPSHSLIVQAPTGTFLLGNNPPIQRGTPLMHPGPGKSSVIRWMSPINGQVQVLARVSDANAGCGNGVTWAVLRDGVSVASGTLANGVNGDVVQLSLPVQSSNGGYGGTALYFVVSPNGNNHQCDTTIFDVLIAGK